MALWLTTRRQRNTELTLVDATERRITEPYTKAAELLGSDQAPCGWPACTPWSAWRTALLSTVRPLWM